MTQREKLAELIGRFCYYPVDMKLVDYLIANGVVVLPCKVGDTVFAAEEYPVIPLIVSGTAVFLDGSDGGDFEHIENFGKTVFLTREAAEAALIGEYDGSAET